ncbi:hypothetical protein ABTY61_21580 [Kitasatospora sp. NPDC096128]|uniref:hypothetical protein n=1 Tax=Kitasatospora sp. NPDC096128 TaxID=3155547 RepID=UPI00332C6282
MGQIAAGHTCAIKTASGGLISADWCIEHFAQVLVGLPDLAEADPARPELLIHEETVRSKHIQIYYTPFDRSIDPDVKVILVGVTPGRRQLHLAVQAAQAALTEGRSPEEAVRQAGQTASFAGSMRKTAVTMLDAIGLAEALGITTASTLFGEHAGMCATTSAVCHAVFVNGNYETVRIVVDGPPAIQTRMRLFGYKGKVLHDCDGTRFLAPEAEAGKPCGCPGTFAEKRLAARSYRGPQPSISIRFKLAAEPALGEFIHVSGSRALLETVPDLQRALAEASGPATCEISLELVKLTTASGRSVCFRKPVVRVIGDLSEPEPRPVATRRAIKRRCRGWLRPMPAGRRGFPDRWVCLVGWAEIGRR